MTEEKGLYEVAYHLKPSLSEEGLDVEIGNIRTILDGEGATVVSEERAKSFALAYPITKSGDGKRETFESSYFGHIVFETTTESAKNIEEKINNLGSVLRVMVIHTYKPAPVVRTKARSVFARKEKETEGPKTEEVSEETLDKEIEKLVVE